MRPLKPFVLATLATAFLWTIALLVLRAPVGPREVAGTVRQFAVLPAASDEGSPPPTQETLPRPGPGATLPATLLSGSAPATNQVAGGATPPTPPGAAAGRSTKPPVMDPIARVALGLVGVDAEAETYWISAINDDSLSAHERQDLIEDLNEEGFADPHDPQEEELPLILNRLVIIEDLAPYAMDQVNAEAFLEAYKDLWNMVLRLAP